ncbi:hypothetical protein CDL12_20984 [Handroanthus impetiginosus]|uniref:Uncharacterized protein n=1 Tax=Handroanthus impetiginosus TaxID=429701 RepID=A0A2G9GML8_9LAMI|nr:hypothetical protein CDL12_20984 [Handroanthus impetiginosus]
MDRFILLHKSWARSLHVLGRKQCLTMTSSSGAPQRISPQSISSEPSQKNSPRAASSEVSEKISPRVVRKLKTSPRYLDPTASSSNLATITPKERSPNVSDHRSPKSPLSGKKHPRRVAELESQISQLENDLKNVKDQLTSSEISKNQAEKDAQESNRQLLALSAKLEESQKQILEQLASEKAHVVELSETSDEQDQKLRSELEAIRKQHSKDSAALASALDEIERLKIQLEMVTESEATHTKHSESARTELQKLKENLEETLSVMEEMKSQIRDCKESEARAQELVGETLMQLETAKKMVETLRSDGSKATNAYDAVASELEESRTRVKFLEELVSKLKAEKDSQNKNEIEIEETEVGQSTEMELTAVKLEVEQLRSALQVAEIRYNDEQARLGEETRHAFEMVEQIKSASGQREAELEAELRKSRYEIEELRANLMDKETELQGICEENDGLIMQLENTLSGQREHELENELHNLMADIEKLKARFMDKETEYQNLSEENDTLKLEIKKILASDEFVSELEAARAAEREALMKIGYMTEEVDKSNRKVARVTEQLEAAQAANAEMEAELRRLKVQSDQFRKAAEAAASMLSAGNNGKLMERTGSMDSGYSPRTRRISSPYTDDLDDDLLKKKNANLLRRFGVLWKKPQK